MLFEYGLITSNEKQGVNSVLNSAAMTYVAAAAVAVLELTRLILIYTGMSRSE